jgi:hypothetical protein
VSPTSAAILRPFSCRRAPESQKFGRDFIQVSADGLIVPKTNLRRQPMDRDQHEKRLEADFLVRLKEQSNE